MFVKVCKVFKAFEILVLHRCSAFDVWKRFKSFKRSYINSLNISSSTICLNLIVFKTLFFYIFIVLFKGVNILTSFKRFKNFKYLKKFDCSSCPILIDFKDLKVLKFWMVWTVLITFLKFYFMVLWVWFLIWYVETFIVSTSLNWIENTKHFT